MKSISSLSFAATALLLGASHAMSVPSRIAERQYGDITYVACYSSSSGLTFNTTDIYNSKGSCQTQCVGMGKAVEATTNKKDCWCGDSLPPSSAVVSDSYCNDPCAGFGTEMCGSAGSKYFSVYTDGFDDSSVDTSGVSASASAAASSSTTTSSSTTPKSTASPTTSAKPSVVTAAGQTIVVTASSSSDPTASATNTQSASSGGTSKAGIAAGVVVGIVAIAAIAGGLYLFIRNKRRREVEEEYKRNAAVSSFVNGGKPPMSSGGASSFNDTRLDPVMAQRRMSDGSIADNQDYSRRILKVTNA